MYDHILIYKLFRAWAMHLAYTKNAFKNSKQNHIAQF